VTCSLSDRGGPNTNGVSAFMEGDVENLPYLENKQCCD